jgi:hypothetical protein
MWVFKERRQMLSCGIRVRLWRRAEFCLGQSDFIIAEGVRDVCEGDHPLDVMNQWGTITMKIVCLAIGQGGNFSGIEQVAVVGNEC